MKTITLKLPNYVTSESVHNAVEALEDDAREWDRIAAPDQSEQARVNRRLAAELKRQARVLR